MTDDRYDRVTFRGHTFDKMTVAALLDMESRLGYELTILQGSFNTSVGPSAGTHSGGGAVDLSPADYANKVRVGREVGFAMWHRPYLANEWPEHIHGILAGDDSASQAAKDQIVYYNRGEDGLVDHGPDNGPRIALHPYHYDPQGATDAQWASGDVYVSKLTDGQTHSDSVKRLQYRLKKHHQAGTPSLAVDGSYGENTRAAVQRWQRKVATLPPNDGMSVTGLQAERLFGKAYRVLS